MKKAIVTKLVQVTFNDAPKNITTFGKAGIVPYHLIREPENQQDANAISVCAYGQFYMGYIPPALAKGLAPLMDAGQVLVAQFVKINQSDISALRGITVKIVKANKKLAKAKVA